MILSTDPQALIATAYHEAGHAVAAVLMGYEFQHVTIVPGEDDLGHVLYERYTAFLNVGHRKFARDLREYLVCNRAGPLAEAQHTGQQTRLSPGDDEDFWRMLWQMYGERRERHARDLTRQARQLVAAHWQSIERVAQALIQEQTLSFETVKQLVQP